MCVTRRDEIVGEWEREVRYGAVPNTRGGCPRQVLRDGERGRCGGRRPNEGHRATTVEPCMTWQSETRWLRSGRLARSRPVGRLHRRVTSIGWQHNQSNGGRQRLIRSYVGVSSSFQRAARPKRGKRVGQLSSPSRGRTEEPRIGEWMDCRRALLARC